MWAQHSTAAQMENVCRKYQMVKRLAEKRVGDDESRRYVSRTMLDDGMVKITAVLRPDEAATVMGVIEQAAKRVAAEASGDVSAETPTRLTNLVAICSYHHTFVHEHGYSVRFEDGEPVF